MDYLSQYIVPFHDLNDKQHTFDFVVNNEFFNYFEEGIVKGGDIKVQLTVVKKTSGLHLSFSLSGFVKIICDRCLELYNQDINFEDSIFVEFGEETDFDTNRDVVILDKNTSEINISQFIYEFSNFALPLQHYHPDTADGKPGCNPEMLELLNKHLLKKEDQVIDPRWEKLKELKK
jgi:uncharacterized metal-binding protein YceD (DUF177 family)